MPTEDSTGTRLRAWERATEWPLTGAAVVFLGAYIYEYETAGYVGKSGTSRVHTPHNETITLTDYRARHGRYKQDLARQRAHAAAPWIVTFDDHEVDNNWAAAIPEDHTPLTAFALRRARALRAQRPLSPARYEIDASTACDVVVIGAGPCGLFATLILAQMGFRPILLERGKVVADYEARKALIKRDAELAAHRLPADIAEGGPGRASEGAPAKAVLAPQREQSGNQLRATLRLCIAAGKICICMDIARPRRQPENAPDRG